MTGAGPSRLIPFILLLLTFYAAHADDADVLVAFRTTLGRGPEALPDWARGSLPCLGGVRANWTGVICYDGAVYGLQLENMGLTGTLDFGGLAGLPGVRALSFTNNALTGPMPGLEKLPGLRTIFLSRNRLSGTIRDDAFTVAGSLKKVHLEWNEFTGPVPGSLAGLSRLLEVRLEGNGFTGVLPEFRSPDLALFNASNNNLEGPIPGRLSKMDASSFSGNKGLCGAPLETTCGEATPVARAGGPTVVSNSKPASKSSISTPLLVAIIVIIVGVALAILGLFLAFFRRKQDREDRLGRPPPPPKKSSKFEEFNANKLSPNTPELGDAVYGGGKKGGGKEEPGGKLVFVREDTEKFEMQDLLRSSAEVLGSGNFGSSYKAVLLSGPAMVVKRFKEMNGVGKEEFHEHMRRLGRLSHPNLLPLVAYYYRKEEKLLVTEYVPMGSLAHLLHGTRGSKVPALDWPARLKIVKGVAKGLAYLYEELPTLTLPHGHLKSSNVLLNEGMEPMLMDYGLSPVMNQSYAAQVMVAYKSPEYRQLNRTSKKSDLWSLGILILEILTGKFPANNLKQGSPGSDLAAWVNSVVREEWTGEVFDKEMREMGSAEGEMLKLLQIGLGCSEANVEKRWDLAMAVMEIEGLKVREVEEDYSSYISDGDLYSSRAMTEEFSFSKTIEL